VDENKSGCPPKYEEVGGRYRCFSYMGDDNHHYFHDNHHYHDNHLIEVGTITSKEKKSWVEKGDSIGQH
jgi:hypothetical protein